MQTQKSHRPKSGTLTTSAILIILSIIFFKQFVWDGYIANPTVGDALEGLDGRPGVSEDIGGRHNVTLKPFEDGFKVYGFQKGLFGWQKQVDFFLGLQDGETFELTEKKAPFKELQDMNLVFVMVDSSVAELVGYGKDGDPLHFNATVNGAVKLFYVYTEAPLEEMEYEATDQDGRSFTIQ